MLYPTELRGRIGIRAGSNFCRLLRYLLSSFLNVGQSYCDFYHQRQVRWGVSSPGRYRTGHTGSLSCTLMSPIRKAIIFHCVSAGFYLSGCATAPSLSVQLVHPKTKVVQFCSAREASEKDIPSLLAAVEACARQLEARGFVRVEHPRGPSE